MLLTANSYVDFKSYVGSLPCKFTVFYINNTGVGGTFDMLALCIEDGEVIVLSRINPNQSPTTSQFLSDFPNAVIMTNITTPTSP